MAKNKKFKVTDNDSSLRLDVFLTQKMDISRSQAQKYIEQQKVKLNDAIPSKTGAKISAGDIVIFEEKEIISEKKEKIKFAKEIVENLQPEIISEEKDFLVVNKPSGLLTHNTEKDEVSLAEILVKKFPELKNVGEDPLRPGIVHRLDKEASGLLVVARNQKMFDFLKKQFKERTIDKEYAVLVHDKVIADTGKIDFPLKRGRNIDRVAAVPKIIRGIENEEGKEALTEFWVEKRFVNFSLLTVKIYTGRMHQIRAHFLAYDHPVVGDPIYFQRKQKRKWDNQLGRLFLHCFKLEFTDLEGKRKHYEVELPDELKSFLKKIK